jgi:predicted CXXCH cytochrome family protein
MTARGVTRLIVTAIVAAFCGVFASASPAAEETFRGEAEIILGETLHAAFPAPGAAPHRFTFYATVRTKLSASVKKDAGSSLKPGLRLLTPGGQKVDVGAAYKETSSGPKITDFAVKYAGYYVLEVSAKKGSGGYTIATRRKGGTTYNGYYDSPPENPYFSFYGPEGAVATVLVAPEKKGPNITITGLKDPDGIGIPFLSNEKGDAAEVSGIQLTQTGAFSVEWTNTGSPGRIKLTFTFVLPEPQGGVRQLGTSEGMDVTVIEPGDPVDAPRDGYVGSAACGRCHSDKVSGWSATAHNSAVRSWNRAGLSGRFMTNDANANGADDFHDGLDLATTPPFAVYGADAPKLLFNASSPVPYQVRIGTQTYTVDRTMGGNDLYAQRYLTKLGSAYHALPFQFDEVKRVYSVVDANDWYTAQNTSRNITATTAPKDRSFEAQCAGCHNTGMTLSGTEASGYTTGYVEMNIGCEQCHGPGAEHVKQGDISKILNPVKGLTAASATAANDVCNRCHDKGLSVDALPGSTTKAGYGFSRIRGLPQAGDDPTNFKDVTADPADFWGAKSNPLPPVPGNTTVASRGHPLQGLDLEAGHHPIKGSYSPVCYECHDPHGSTNPHLVATTIRHPLASSPPLTTRLEDNSLCLACHVGMADFADVTREDVQQLAAGVTTAAVSNAGVNHMKDRGMPVDIAQYDPAGTGIGRCSTCHMPQTPSVGTALTDAAGFAKGDLHSHRFEVVWPRASALYGVTNSCSVCHPTRDGDQVAKIIDDWANPAPEASQTAFHGATPPSEQFNVPLTDSVKLAGGGGQKCIACHTRDGFVQILVNKSPILDSTVESIAKKSIALDRGLSCDSCHGKREDGNFYGTNRNPLRIEHELLCATCHNDRGVDFASFQLHGTVVRHPQREMLAGTAGSTPPGIPDSATTAHSSFSDGCVTCHYDVQKNVQSHKFTPEVATCTGCHPGLTTFNRPAQADYDGDGVTEGIQDEVRGLLEVLKAALLGDPQISFANGFFDYGAGTDHSMSGASLVQKRSVHNWYTVEDDRSFGVHDAARAVQLLQASYRELTGVDVPGAIIR